MPFYRATMCFVTFFSFLLTSSTKTTSRAINWCRKSKSFLEHYLFGPVEKNSATTHSHTQSESVLIDLYTELTSIFNCVQKRKKKRTKKHCARHLRDRIYIEFNTITYLHISAVRKFKFNDDYYNIMGICIAAI